MVKKTCLGLGFMAALLAGFPMRASTLADVAFLAGCWRGELSKGNGWTEERYSPPEGGMMLGTSQTVVDRTTKFFEFIQITENAGEVEMTPSPRGQKSVPFRMVRIEGKRAVFENLEHDFPKRIIYHLKDDGSLLARIEGAKPEQAQDFLMKPVACK
jgi:Domain of unknown function (DUF6265)